MLAIEGGFLDRREAGRRLANELAKTKWADPIVLALPRGGVPVAFEIAKALHAPLDILLVRKIGAPEHPEFGVGAVVDGNDPQLLLNDDALRMLGISSDYIEKEETRQLHEIERRRERYLGGRAAIPVEHRTAIVVDDGIATGSTAAVALKAVQKSGAARTVLAVPVAPPEVIHTLRAEADEVVCLSTPAQFQTVGSYYVDFEQTSDEEVVELLHAAEEI
ncbi:phosphoribosyltransferase [Mesorhizobium sp. M0488]|uniref:phosphoribosyltransferase n=1 Tax=unclassified Mesorhizobium TaxID=325217 RepID=UPI00333E188E